MKILGITGGIGSGKSVVSRLLQLMDVPVYLSDDESKLLLDTSSELKKILKENFGEEIYVNDLIDRKKFASIIFQNPEKLQLANSIIHPFVKRHFSAWLEQQEMLGKKLVGIESAILFESGFNLLVNKTIFVYAPVETRLERVVNRDQVKPANVLSRMKNQNTDDENREKSDFVILNDGQSSILTQVHQILRLFCI